MHPNVMTIITHLPPVHLVLMQSRACRQVLPTAHGVQTPPPQSMSVSLKFLRPSLQKAERSTHEPPPMLFVRHEPDLQSRPDVQLSPGSQGGHSVPPQSTSDSSPSFIVLVHCTGSAMSPRY